MCKDIAPSAKNACTSATRRSPSSKSCASEAHHSQVFAATVKVMQCIRLAMISRERCGCLPGLVRADLQKKTSNYILACVSISLPSPCSNLSPRQSSAHKHRLAAPLKQAMTHLCYPSNDKISVLQVVSDRYVFYCSHKPGIGLGRRWVGVGRVDGQEKRASKGFKGDVLKLRRYRKIIWHALVKMLICLK